MVVIKDHRNLSKCLFVISFAVYLGCAMVLLEQGLTALRADKGSWAVGRWGELQGLDGDSQAWECPPDPEPAHKLL